MAFRDACLLIRMTFFITQVYVNLTMPNDHKGRESIRYTKYKAMYTWHHTIFFFYLVIRFHSRDR
jgi:hypothetical protein